MNPNVHLYLVMFVSFIGVLALHVPFIVGMTEGAIQRVSLWLTDLTTEVSGEDSDQEMMAIGATDLPTAGKMAREIESATLVDELNGKLDTPRTRRYWALGGE